MFQSLLTNINSQTNWGNFLVALFLIEACLLVSFRLLPAFWGATINEWYDQFGLVAIMLDVLIVLIGFWLTMWIYPKLFNSSNVSGSSSSNDFKITLWKFLLLFLVIQIIHDLAFYFLIIRTSKGSNAIIDLIQKYSTKHGGLTVLGDSLMVALAVLMWWMLSSQDVEFGGLVGILLVSLYVIGYALYTRWQ